MVEKTDKERELSRRLCKLSTSLAQWAVHNDQLCYVYPSNWVRMENEVNEIKEIMCEYNTIGEK